LDGAPAILIDKLILSFPSVIPEDCKDSNSKQAQSFPLHHL